MPWQVLILGLLLSVGCAHGSPGSVTPTREGGVVAVRVESHNWSDVVLRYRHGGTWERLGLAGALATTNFFIPWNRVASNGTIRLQADPVNGGPPIYTEVLPVQVGQMIIWTLESRLEQSSAGVY